MLRRHVRVLGLVSSLAVLVIFAVMSLGSEVAQAAPKKTFYVSPTGATTGGSCDTPNYSTIQEAVEAATGRDTIKVCA